MRGRRRVRTVLGSLGPSFIASVFKAAAALQPLQQSPSPPTSPGLPVAEKGARVKRLARCVVVGNLKKIEFAGEKGENRGSRSLRAISLSLAISTPSGDVGTALPSLTQATPSFLLCDLKSHFRVNKWPGEYLQGEVWLNMENWLLMDKRPKAGSFLQTPERTLESCSYLN